MTLSAMHDFSNYYRLFSTLEQQLELPEARS